MESKPLQFILAHISEHFVEICLAQIGRQLADDELAGVRISFLHGMLVQQLFSSTVISVNQYRRHLALVAGRRR